MDVVEVKNCPFCKEAVDVEFDFCPECGHSFEEISIKRSETTIDRSDPVVKAIISKTDQEDYTRQFVITFVVGLVVMVPVFIGLFAIGMWSWANLDHPHYMVGFTFLIVSTLGGGGIGFLNKNEKTTVIKAIIIAILYAISVSIVVSVYIMMDAGYAWEYALPITGVVGSTLNIVFFAW